MIICCLITATKRTSGPHCTSGLRPKAHVCYFPAGGRRRQRRLAGTREAGLQAEFCVPDVRHEKICGA